MNEDKANVDLIEDSIIEEAELEGRPQFYDSPTASMLPQNFEGGYDVYENLIRLITYRDVNVTLAPATQEFFEFEPGSGIGFWVTIPTTTTIEVEHGVKGEIPFVFSYSYLIGNGIIAPNPEVNTTTFKATIVNDSFYEATARIRYYIYELLSKSEIL